jgi:hypothetical protein
LSLEKPGHLAYREQIGHPVAQSELQKTERDER